MKSEIVSVLAMAMLVPAPMVSAQFYSADMTFMTIVDSPRAAAMGNCVVNLVDKQSALYNPRALGLLHLDRRFAVSYPFRTQWLPQLANDVFFKAFNVSWGMAFEISPSQAGQEHIFSSALGYSRLKLDLSVSRRQDEFGNTIYTLRPHESADNFTFAVGADYFLRVGLGATYKRARSELDQQVEGKATTFDVGVATEFPVVDLFFFRRSNQLRRRTTS